MKLSDRTVFAGLAVTLAALLLALVRPTDLTVAVALVLVGGAVAYLLASGVLQLGTRLKPQGDADADEAAGRSTEETDSHPDQSLAGELAPTSPPPEPDHLSVRDRLRVLLLLSRPLNVSFARPQRSPTGSSDQTHSAQAPARVAWQAIVQALADRQSDVELATVWPPTEASLETAMRASPRYHLLVIEAPLSDGLPLFEGETGEARRLNAGRLADCLAIGRVRAVVIRSLSPAAADTQALIDAGIETVVSVPSALSDSDWTGALAQIVSGLSRGETLGRVVGDVAAGLDTADVASRLRPVLAGSNWYSLVDRGGDGLGLRLVNQPLYPELRRQNWFRDRGPALRHLLGLVRPGWAGLLPVGPPGSGVTSLAIEVAHRLSSRYERVIHVECSALVQADLASVLESLALSLGCLVLNQQALLESVVGELRRRPALVLVDEAELLAQADRERLLSLDGHLGPSSVLLLCATDDGETAFTSDGLDAEGAVAWVRWLGQQEGMGFLSSVSDRSVQALVEGLAGNPLAMRLALGQAGPLGLLQSVRSARAVGSLDGVLRLVLARLTPRQRDAASVLALIPGPVQEDVVSAALGRDARPALEEMQRLGLLADSLYEGEYRLHPLVRADMAQHRPDSRACIRLAEALAARARSLYARIEEDGDTARQEAISEILALWPSLLTALGWASAATGPLAGRLDLVRDICQALAPILRERRLLCYALQMARRGEEAAALVSDHVARGRFLLEAAEAERDAGHTEEASSRLAAAADAFERAHDYRRAAHALVRLGTMHWEGRRLADARGPFERALTCLQRIGEVEAQVNALMVLGHIAGQEESCQRAKEYYQQAARALEKEEGHLLLRAQVHYALGRCHSDLADFREAAQAYALALEAFTAAGDLDGRIQACRSLGKVYLKLADRERAVQALERAAQLEERAPFGLDASMDLLRIYMRERRWQEALEHQQRALARARAAGDGRGLALAHNGMGSVLLELGNRKLASEHFLEAARLWEELGDDVGLAWAYNNLGVADRRSGKWEEARAHLTRAAQLLEKRGEKNALASVYNNMGLILAAQRREREAARFYERSLALKEELGDLYGTRMTEQNLKKLNSRDR
ncbi:MAG: tetratricopeptide repeat protein [Anaerolineae bacterium]|nr:tetratricopeptide repeat protein [Anaerolineae bacterium]